MWLRVMHCWFRVLVCLLGFATGALSVCPSECFCFKRRVDCSNRNLHFVPEVPRGTTHLELQGNQLVNVTLEDFSGLNKLLYLDLSDNQIEVISEATFTETPRISSLILKKNQLVYIPPSINHLEHLSRLDLRSNSITEITNDNIRTLSTIFTVDLSRNKIEKWNTGERTPSARKRHMLIAHLDLSANKLSTLPADAFMDMSSLNILKLTRNQLVSISPDHFRGLVDVRVLDLSRNHIRILPSLLFHSMTELTNVSLGRNEIWRLEDGVFFGADRLLSLNLSHNGVQNISGGWLYGLQSLHTLDLSSNSVGWFDPIVWQDLSSLKVLSLAGNRLRSLPSAAFRKLPQLIELDLSNNSIEILHKTAMAGLNRLRSLDISSNALAVCVEDGAVLYNTSLPYLKELKFTNNNLKVLPSRAFERFPTLEVLDLRDNPIATMHSEAFDPLHLRVLYLNTSSLLCDCKLEWWTRWLFNSGLDRSSIVTRCSHPTPLADLDVTAIDAANLTCMDDSPRPRILIHPPSTVKTLVGAEARLSCSGYGQAPVHLEWRVIESGRARTFHEDPNTQITVNRTDVVNGTWNGRERLVSELVLSQVDLQDRAEYQCIVRNRFGTDYSQRSTLVVHQKPSFTFEPEDYSLLVGENAQIACSASGVPQPVIKWQKDGGDEFPAASDRRLHVRSNDDHLYVVNVKPEDAGEYTCHATNEAGSILATATLRVFENTFRSALHDVKVNEGETVLLDCMADLADGQHMIWIKGDDSGLENAVISSPRATLKAKQQLLIMVKVLPSDSGVYTCQLWAGAHLLTQQSSVVTVIPIEREFPEMAYSLEAPGHSNAQKYTVLGLGAILLGFFVLGIVFGMLYYRRAARTSLSHQSSTLRVHDRTYVVVSRRPI